MRAIISSLILPLPVVWIFILLAFIQYIRKKKTLFHIFTLVSILWVLVISTPFVPNLLAKSLENRYSVISEKTIKNIKKPVNILILGGGHIDDERLPANSQLGGSSIARLTEGIRIHRQLQGSTIITSGYAGKNNDTPDAIISARTAILLGVDPKNIKWQKHPKNTWQEALTYKHNFGDSARFVLVTSAIHMPRTMYLFRKTGLNPIAAPTDFMVRDEKRKNILYWLPSSNNIKKMENAIHEYVGLLWYMMGGS